MQSAICKINNEGNANCGQAYVTARHPLQNNTIFAFLSCPGAYWPVPMVCFLCVSLKNCLIKQKNQTLISDKNQGKLTFCQRMEKDAPHKNSLGLQKEQNSLKCHSRQKMSPILIDRKCHSYLQFLLTIVGNLSKLTVSNITYLE